MLKSSTSSKNKKSLRAYLRFGTLDTYFLTSAIPTFLISLSVILAALMLERLLVLLDLLAADSSPLGTFIGLLADLVPHYLGLAIPAALCVAIFSSVRQMSMNNEIDALLASGISLLRCARPYIISGCIIGFLCIILYGYIQPFARYDFRAAFFYASQSGWVPHLQSHMVVQPNSDLVMIVDNADQHGTHMSGVFIQQNTKNKNNEPITHIIISDQGNLYMPHDRSKVDLRLYKGQTLTLNPHNNNNITDFDHSERILQKSNKHVAFRERGDDERELTITELYWQLRHHTNKIPYLDMKAEFHFRLVRALSIMAIPILATGLAIMKKRTRRNFGLAIAAIVLVSYDHIQQLGADLVSTGRYSPFISLWIPLFIFLSICSIILISKNGFWGLYPTSLLKQTSKTANK